MTYSRLSPSSCATGRLRRWVLMACLMTLITVPGFAADGPPDMDRAGRELGIRMLRPNAQIKPGNRYIATVENPVKLARIGLEGLRPGDRVICRAMEGNRIVLFDSRGDQTAPIQLAASGAVKEAKQVPKLNSHVNKHRELRSSKSESRGSRTGLSGFSGIHR